MSQKRVAHEVDLQAQQIRRVLAQHQLDAELVESDVVQDDYGRQTSFGVRAKLAAGWQQAQALARDLQQTLGQEVLVEDEEGHLTINLFQRDKPPVELLDVLELVPDVPLLTAVLGWTAADNPLWLDLTTADTAHILLAGQHGAGKTALLRTMSLSLALNNPERELQLAIISIAPDEVPLRKRQELQPLEYLPHMLCPIATNQPDAQQMLHFLGQETHHRQAHGIVRPRIVLMVDHADELLQQGGATAVEALTYLLRQGAPAGIHLVLSFAEPDTAVLEHLEDLLDANLPTRLVGQLPTAEQAEIATDVYDSGAEQLAGAGDFLAVLGETMVHFQAAFVSDYDFHLCLEHLYEHRPPALLAQPFDPRPRPRRKNAQPEHYSFNWSSHVLHEPSPEVSDTAVTVNRLSRPVEPVEQTESRETPTPRDKEAEARIEQALAERVKEAEERQAQALAQQLKEAEERQERELAQRVKEAEERKERELVQKVREAQERQEKELARKVREAEERKERELVQRVKEAQERQEKELARKVREAEERKEKELMQKVQEAEERQKQAWAQTEKSVPVVPVVAETLVTPLPLPTARPWADLDPAAEDEIPFDWLAVDPVAPDDTAVSPSPFDFAEFAAPDPAPLAPEKPQEPEELKAPTAEVNPTVRDLLKWRKRLPPAQPQRVMKIVPADMAVLPAPAPDTPLTPTAETSASTKPNLVDLLALPDDDFDVLSEFSSADELKWLDEWDEMGDPALVKPPASPPPAPTTGEDPQ